MFVCCTENIPNLEILYLSVPHRRQTLYTALQLSTLSFGLHKGFSIVYRFANSKTSSRGKIIIDLREKHFVIKCLTFFAIALSDYKPLILSPFSDMILDRSLSPALTVFPSSFSSFSDSPFFTVSLLCVLTCLAR